MKPVRLQVQGFMPFRLHQEVEFTGSPTAIERLRLPSTQG